MVNIEELRKIVKQSLEQYIGCPVVRSNQNAPMPKYPYCAYTVTTPATENNGTYGEYDDGVARKPVNTVISFTVRSDDNIESVTLANKARDYLDYAGITHLNDNGVIVQSVTSVSNRDNVITCEYEHANGFDCYFWCFDEAEAASKTNGTIEHASANVSQREHDGIIVDVDRTGMTAYGKKLTAVIRNGGLVITEETVVIAGG